MRYKGRDHAPLTMIEAARSGIGMIVQEQGCVLDISIARNIFLGVESRFKRRGLISSRAMNQAASEVLERLGLGSLDPSMRLDRLDMQDRKLIELARVMAEGPEVLIVDETTTALSHWGREKLYDIMNRMRADGKAVIFISHDLDELMEYCDVLVVLRDGVKVARMDREDFDAKLIKSQMVGRDLGDKYYREDYGAPISDEVVLKAESITTASGLLMNFSMDVHRGEILGIGGLSHCGMHELGKALFGDERLLTGRVLHLPSGDELSSPRKAISHSMGYVSKDRDREALVLSASIRENIAAAALDLIDTRGFILPGAERRHVMKQVDSLSIKCASIDQHVQYLSGGNKQKVVFGKWVGRDCDILILDCPTRGVDVGVKAAMYALMEDMKREGKSIVMISEELPELIGMSDRTLILKDGRLSGEFLRSPDLTEQDIIESMI